MTEGQQTEELKPSQAMCNAARWFILARDAGITTWSGLIPSIPSRPTIPYIEEQIAKNPTGHITKWDVADCVYQLMATASPRTESGLVKELVEALETLYEANKGTTYHADHPIWPAVEMARTALAKAKPTDKVPEVEEPTITVCSACLQASCWLGIFYCDDYQTAGIVEKTRAELKKLNLENSDYWKEPKVGAI